MRKIIAYLSPLLLAAGAIGCDDKGEDDGGTAQPDAFVPPEVDGGGQIADAAPTPDAAPTTLQLTVVSTDNQQPAAGATVVVHAPDGTIKGMISTDTVGQAQPEVLAGDLVTVAYDYPSKGQIYELTTIVGVKPGDVIVVGPPLEGIQVDLGTLSVIGPGDQAGATYYTMDTGCEGGFSGTPLANPFTTTLTGGCHADPTTTPVYVRAMDQFDNPVGYLVNAAVPLAPMTGGMASFASWRTDFLFFSSTVTNLPVTASTLDELFLIAASGETLFMSQNQFVGTGGVPPIATYSLPMDLATGWLHLVRVDGRGILEKGAWPIANSSFDNDADFSASVTVEMTANETDPARPTFTLTRGTNGSTTADVAHLALEYYGDGYTRWHVIAPGDTTTFTFPPLPEALAAYRMGPKSFSGFQGVFLVDIDAAGVGYDQLRALGGSYPYGSVHGLMGFLARVPAGLARTAEHSLGGF